MQLRKITTIEAVTTDGKTMVDGMSYIIVISDRSLCGIYRGITKKGALMFDVPVRSENIRFNIMPNSVKKIFEATIGVKQEYMNEPEVAADEN